MPSDREECELLGPVALTVQCVLGLLSMSSLLYKRMNEGPVKRPFKIWVFDVSKQVIGASFIHILNLVLSIISKIKLISSLSIKKPKWSDDNPCDYYFLNILFDTTIGIPILFFFITLITKILIRFNVRGVKSGEYDTPPKLVNYFKQLIIYLCSLGLMKVSIYYITMCFPILVKTAIWLLSIFDKYPNTQITFVLLIFPLIMNAFQYYVVDNLIQSHSYYKVNKLIHEEEEGYGSV